MRTPHYRYTEDRLNLSLIFGTVSFIVFLMYSPNPVSISIRNLYDLQGAIGTFRSSDGLLDSEAERIPARTGDCVVLSPAYRHAAL